MGQTISQQVGANPDGVPPDSPHAGLDESPGMFGRVMGRLFGTDVNDPMPWTRMGTTVGGAIAGGYLGSQVPGGPMVKGAAIAAGSVAGTVGGAVAPETTLEVLEKMGFIEPGERERLGLNDDQLVTVLEGEAMLDVLTMGGVSLARLTGRGISNIMTGANHTTRGIAEHATREGIAMLPVQVGERTFGRGFVSVVGRFPWVSSGLKKRAEAAMGQIQQAYESIPGRLGPLSTFDEVGASIMRDANETATAISTQATARLDELYRRADFQGITVRPVNTRAITDTLLKRLAAETPQGVKDTKLPLPKAQRELRDFINLTTKKLTDTVEGGITSGNEIADQSLRRMESILVTIDEKMTKFRNAGEVVAEQRLERLRQAVQMDMLTKTGQGAEGASTPASRAITAEIRQIDDQLTNQVRALFLSTSGSRMGGIVSPTLRAARFASLGTRDVADLAQVVLKGDNPAIIGELHRFARPETMRELGNAVFNEALNKSIQETGVDMGRFDIEGFSKALGLHAPTSAKYRQTEALLDAVGGISMPDLQRLVEIGRRASMAEIPNTSAFLARKAAFTPMKGLLMSSLPIGAGLAGYSGGMWASVFTVGGAKLVSAMISNPASARALSKVLDVEASTGVKRAATLRATGLAIGNMVRDRVITSEEAHNLSFNLGQAVDIIDKRFRQDQNQ